MLAQLSPEQVTATESCWRADHRKADARPGTMHRSGGLKVTTESGWFAARPSGTEDVYKIYAESFQRRRPPRAHPNGSSRSGVPNATSDALGS